MKAKTMTRLEKLEARYNPPSTPSFIVGIYDPNNPDIIDLGEGQTMNRADWEALPGPAYSHSVQRKG